jgi:hypothetical protein
MLPELMPSASGLLCPDHGDTLAWRLAEGWTVLAACTRGSCGFEVPPAEIERLRADSLSTDTDEVRAARRAELFAARARTAS